ncbi:MAG: arylsulfatase [Bacteroidales bacterium]
MSKKLIASAAVCISGAFLTFSLFPEKAQKPNVIFILADDLGYGDLSCYGQTRFKTPNIDRLASQGMLFTQHYTGCTVSAPSRSCLMTGLHTGHTPIRGNKGWTPEGQWPLPAGSLTIAEMMKSAGYTTGAFGKWGLGYVGTDGDPNNQGFDIFYGYNCQSLAHNYYPDHLWYNNNRIELRENAGGKTGAYSGDLIQSAALRFIEENNRKPFFMYYPTTIPHAELIAKDDQMALFRNKFNPEKPYRGTDTGPDFRQGPYTSQPEPHAAFAAMVKQLDDYVGQILDKLAELGIEKNTIVIFASDNGPHLEGGGDPDYFNSNGPYRGYKRDLYEGGIRTPLIVKWPGHVKQGSTSDHVSAFWDFLPTLAEITGKSVEADIDGISFLPELTGKRQKQHEYLYWEFHEQGGKEAVRFGNWKGVRLNVDKDPEGNLELYNLSTDPGETSNVAESNPGVVKKIDELIKASHIRSEVFPFSAEVVK